jgi:4-amino-4-deoxy-L-arabinose transferase-like glycosyltransferase
MHRLGTQDRHAIILLVVLSSILFCASGYVNQVPLHDDKAYLNNAPIHSGRLAKNDALGPYADERPPLFWWMLTTIFLLDVPVWSAKLLSPLFGVVLVLATYCFAKKIFNSTMQGFYAGLFLTSGAFMMSTTGALLSDVPGTALATLFMFCLYIGTTEKRNLYLLATGPCLPSP